MKYKEGRNGARRYMAEELYDIMPADPQFQEDLKKALTSCSGDFLYSVRGFSECMQKKNNKKDRRGKDV